MSHTAQTIQTSACLRQRLHRGGTWLWRTQGKLVTAHAKEVFSPKEEDRAVTEPWGLSPEILNQTLMGRTPYTLAAHRSTPLVADLRTQCLEYLRLAGQGPDADCNVQQKAKIQSRAIRLVDYCCCRIKAVKF